MIPHLANQNAYFSVPCQVILLAYCVSYTRHSPTFPLPYPQSADTLPSVHPINCLSLLSLHLWSPFYLQIQMLIASRNIVQTHPETMFNRVSGHPLSQSSCHIITEWTPKESSKTIQSVWLKEVRIGMGCGGERDSCFHFLFFVLPHSPWKIDLFKPCVCLTSIRKIFK